MLKLPKPTRRATEKECNRNIEKAFNKLSNLLKCLILVHRFHGLSLVSKNVEETVDWPDPTASCQISEMAHEKGYCVATNKKCN